MTTMKQFRWFWAWEDEKEEAWLREMALKGWHFVSVSLPGNYTFELGEPRDDVYRLDYFAGQKKDKSDYLQLFLDTGWEYKGEMNGWQYFCQQAVNGELPDIYSDHESKARKYQRIMLIMVIFLPIYMNLIFIGSRHQNELAAVVSIILAAFLLLYSYILVRLLMRVNQLRKKL
ncbi:MAG: DUF2812 domain-containing protein [Anaerolineales bacterium]|nr:DUF2812 domain-containing protein [Anaerolineales bacterium]